MADEPTDLIVIEADGSVRAQSGAAARRLRERHGAYRWIIDAPGLLALRKDGGERGSRVLMAGEVIGPMTVMEVIGVIANTNWRGELHVAGGGVERLLRFDQGALKGAHSSATSDRLGEVLFRSGVVSRKQLDELVRELGPDRRIGQVVIDKKLLDREKLFHYLQVQAEQIFFGALLVRSGGYAFLVSSEEAVAAMPTTIHVPIQGLLMEGVQRVDEMSLFRERIPSTDLCPEVLPRASTPGLEPRLLTILAYCDGERSIAEISRESGSDLFETTKAIYHLLQQGMVTLRSGPTIDEAAVRRLVSAFNDVLRDIFFAVATYGGVDQTRQTVSAWIQGSGYGSWFGHEIDEDGSVAAATVLQGLASKPLDNPLGALHQALHELAAFALFAATTTLPRDQELVLSRDVNRRLKAIRI